MDQTIYFMEFMALIISRKTRKQNNKIGYSQQLQLKLILTAGQRVIAQSIDWIATQTIQNTIYCINARLPLTLLYPTPTQPWTLTVYGNHQPQGPVRQLDLTEQENTQHKQLKKIGSCQLDPNVYAEVFEEYGKVKFQENIAIAPNMSLDYQIFIHCSPEELIEAIEDDRQRSEIKLEDTAFKKAGRQPKIRYIEFQQDREKSLKSEAFCNHDQLKISGLKKSGNKYVPITRQKSPKKRGQQRRKKEGKSSTGNTKNQSKAGSRVQGSNKEPRGEEVGYNGVNRGKGQKRSRFWGLNWMFLISLVVCVGVAGYMMFPSKKV